MFLSVPNLSVRSIYSTLQCLLSIIGSMGVIMLFAGIPQLIYSPDVNPTNLLTFLLGAILITFMVAGNALINYRFKYIMEAENNDNASLAEKTDNPPSYEEVEKGEFHPPNNSQFMVGSPPRYEDIIHTVKVLPSTSTLSTPSIIPISSITQNIPQCPVYSEVCDTFQIDTSNNQSAGCHIIPLSPSAPVIINPLEKDLEGKSSVNTELMGASTSTQYEKSLDAKNFIEIDMSKDDHDNIKNEISKSRK